MCRTRCALQPGGRVGGLPLPHAVSRRLQGRRCFKDTCPRPLTWRGLNRMPTVFGSHPSQLYTCLVLCSSHFTSYTCLWCTMAPVFRSCVSCAIYHMFITGIGSMVRLDICFALCVPPSANRRKSYITLQRLAIEVLPRQGLIRAYNGLQLIVRYQCSENGRLIYSGIMHYNPQLMNPTVIIGYRIFHDLRMSPT